MISAFLNLIFVSPVTSMLFGAMYIVKCSINYFEMIEQDDEKVSGSDNEDGEVCMYVWQGGLISYK